MGRRAPVHRLRGASAPVSMTGLTALRQDTDRALTGLSGFSQSLRAHAQDWEKPPSAPWESADALAAQWLPWPPQPQPPEAGAETSLSPSRLPVLWPGTTPEAAPFPSSRAAGSPPRTPETAAAIATGSARDAEGAEGAGESEESPEAAPSSDEAMPEAVCCRRDVSASCPPQPQEHPLPVRLVVWPISISSVPLVSSVSAEYPQSPQSPVHPS